MDHQVHRDEQAPVDAAVDEARVEQLSERQGAAEEEQHRVGAEGNGVPRVQQGGQRRVAHTRLAPHREEHREGHHGEDPRAAKAAALCDPEAQPHHCHGGADLERRAVIRGPHERGGGHAAQQPHDGAGDAEAQDLLHHRSGRLVVVPRKVPEDEEDHRRRPVVEHGLPVDQDCEALRRPQVVQEGHDCHRVRGAHDRRHHEARVPVPLVREEDGLQKQCGQADADEDPGPGEPQRGHELLFQDVRRDLQRGLEQERGDEDIQNQLRVHLDDLLAGSPELAPAGVCHGHEHKSDAEDDKRVRKPQRSRHQFQQGLHDDPECQNREKVDQDFGRIFSMDDVASIAIGGVRLWAALGVLTCGRPDGPPVPRLKRAEVAILTDRIRLVVVAWLLQGRIRGRRCRLEDVERGLGHCDVVSEHHPGDDLVARWSGQPPVVRKVGPARQPNNLTEIDVLVHSYVVLPCEGSLAGHLGQYPGLGCADTGHDPDHEQRVCGTRGGGLLHTAAVQRVVVHEVHFQGIRLGAEEVLTPLIRLTGASEMDLHVLQHPLLGGAVGPPPDNLREAAH
mmetsp:Transcript_81394/g.143530  ORF Transcript_81394/g.143530 Transcript_81394/m.143530 type:complete len:564 (+) Transcript_81394:1552-3243(+)